MEHRAGYVAILGKPNAGKSTLLNAMMGEKLAIVTAKAQTTRHRIFGIYNDPNLQIVFSDTPGIIKPHYSLQEKMMDAVEESLSDGDLFIFVADAKDPELLQTESPLFQKITKRFREEPEKLILVVNKLDLITQEKLVSICEELNNHFPQVAIHPVSALTGFGVPELFERIRIAMPEHPPYFDKESISDRPVRFFMAEIIREKILLNYEKEIPYSVEVVIENYQEEEHIHRMEAMIYVDRESQKGILIGRQGAALKRVGIQARKDMETFLGCQVFLKLHVKVRKDWRNNPRALEGWGY
jgi:GTPase